MADSSEPLDIARHAARPDPGFDPGTLRERFAAEGSMAGLELRRA